MQGNLLPADGRSKESNSGGGKQMAKPTVKRLDEGQLDMMWNFLRMGYQKPNISALKESLDAIRQMMIQKTAGQDGYRTDEAISFDDLQTHINCVVIEAMCLYLSGTLDRMEDRNESDNNRT
jgi:hypothetical protein